MLSDKHITFINSLYVSRQNTLHTETPYMLSDKHIT